MPIDNCTHSFDELARNVLPEYYARLEAAMKASIAAEVLSDYKSATKAALSAVGKTCDFPGCYVFHSAGVAQYVGISRKVINRLTQHLNHDSHYSASLVYKMTSDEFPHEFKRAQAMKDKKFYNSFLGVQSKLRKMKVAYIEITNDLELYLFEAYASMMLDTSKWNTFRTH